MTNEHVTSLQGKGLPKGLVKRILEKKSWLSSLLNEVSKAASKKWKAGKLLTKVREEFVIYVPGQREDLALFYTCKLSCVFIIVGGSKSVYLAQKFIFIDYAWKLRASPAPDVRSVVKDTCFQKKLNGRIHWPQLSTPCVKTETQCIES